MKNETESKAMDTILVSYQLLSVIKTHAMAIDAGKNTALRHSHEKFVNDAISLKKEVTGKLANLFFDYLVETVKEELTHADKQCEYKFTPDNSLIISSDLEDLDPDTFLDMAENMFYERWSESFGGPMWANIARITKMRNRLPDEIFVDVVTDLQHNTGMALEKNAKQVGSEVLWSPDVLNIKKFLDSKTYGNIVEILSYTDFGCTEVKKLVHRFCMLYLDEMNREDIFKKRKRMFKKVETYGYKLTTSLIDGFQGRHTRENTIKFIDKSWENLKKYKKIEYKRKAVIDPDGVVFNHCFEDEYD